MSKKITDQQQQEATPFFAHLLSGNQDPASLAAPDGGAKPSYPCADSKCTLKYPSDDDESTTWLSDRDM